MDETVAVAFIAVGGTVSTAVLGYAGTRFSTRKQLETAQEGTRIQLQSIRNEVKKLEASQKEELRGARHILYQEFLNAVYAVREFLIGNESADAEMDTFNTAIIAMRDRAIATDLMASDPVRTRAADVSKLMVGLIEGVREKYDDPTSWDDLFSAAFEPLNPKFEYQRDALLKAMRREIQHRDPQS